MQSVGVFAAPTGGGACNPSACLHRRRGERHAIRRHACGAPGVVPHGTCMPAGGRVTACPAAGCDAENKLAPPPSTPDTLTHWPIRPVRNRQSSLSSQPSSPVPTKPSSSRCATSTPRPSASAGEEPRTVGSIRLVATTPPSAVPAATPGPASSTEPRRPRRTSAGDVGFPPHSFVPLSVTSSRRSPEPALVGSTTATAHPGRGRPTGSMRPEAWLARLSQHVRSANVESAPASVQPYTLSTRQFGPDRERMAVRTSSYMGSPLLIAARSVASVGELPSSSAASEPCTARLTADHARHIRGRAVRAVTPPRRSALSAWTIRVTGRRAWSRCCRQASKRAPRGGKSRHVQGTSRGKSRPHTAGHLSSITASPPSHLRVCGAGWWNPFHRLHKPPRQAHTLHGSRRISPGSSRSTAPSRSGVNSCAMLSTKTGGVLSATVSPGSTRPSSPAHSTRLSTPAHECRGRGWPMSTCSSPCRHSKRRRTGNENLSHLPLCKNPCPAGRRREPHHGTSSRPLTLFRSSNAHGLPRAARREEHVTPGHSCHGGAVAACAQPRSMRRRPSDRAQASVLSAGARRPSQHLRPMHRDARGLCRARVRPIRDEQRSGRAAQDGPRPLLGPVGVQGAEGCTANSVRHSRSPGLQAGRYGCVACVAGSRASWETQQVTGR